MAARDVVDIALLEVAIAAGNVELEEVESFTIGDTDAGAETVKTMRRNRTAIGFKSGVSEFEITVEVMPVVGQEVDWFELKTSKEIFKMFYEENDGGQRFVVADCRVTEISKSFNADGEATLSITILALSHKKEA